MAGFSEWVDLGKSTLTSLKGTDLAGSYAQEWPETRERLIAEHRPEIDREPSRFRRFLKTTSAVLFGLAQRLAPHRRILFLLAFVAFFVCLASLSSRMDEPPFWILLEMGAAFLAMTLLLAMELIDKLKYRDELQLARELQASLIPHQMPRTGSWDIAAFNWIANTVGGDIYDFVPLPDGRVAVLFGDASGHGMAAGLVMAVAHASFRTQLEIEASPPSIMASLNRILCRTGGSRSFFACCYVLLSPDGTYLATVAGHPPILRIDAEGKVVERIGRGAYPLGVKSGLIWEVVGGALDPGERLLLHSDGLTEARNDGGRELGDAQVDIIAGWHAASGSSTMVDGIVGEWRRFIGSVPAEDDMSVAVIRRRGERQHGTLNTEH